MNKKASRIPIEEYKEAMKAVEEEYEKIKPKEYTQEFLDNVYLQINNYLKYIHISYILDISNISLFNFKALPFGITREDPGCFWIDRSQFPKVKSIISLYIIEKTAEYINGIYSDTGLDSIYSKLCNMFNACTLLKTTFGGKISEVNKEMKDCNEPFKIFEKYLECLE